MFSELPVDGGQSGLHTPVAGQITLEQKIECTAVVALAVGIVKIGIPIPAGMVRIQLLGALGQSHAALPVARIGQQLTQKSDGVAVHRIECDSPFCRIAEALKFLLEEERLRQSEMGQMIGWLCLNRTSRSG